MRAKKEKKKMSGYVKVPNWVDDDTRMYDTTRMVLFALFARMGSRMAVCISQMELVALTGCCRNTVAKALQELQERGILFSTRRYYYSKHLGRVVRGKTRYYIRRSSEGSFTLVPRELLAEDLTPAEFTVALHAYRLAGRKGRCFPSLRLFARQVDRAKATICRAVKKLYLHQVLGRNHCEKASRAFSCNSYWPTGWVRKKAAQAVCAITGGLKFEQQQAIKKITVGSIKRKREKGVGEFGTLTKFWGKYLEEGQFYFDGTGVKVSTWCEPELTG